MDRHELREKHEAVAKGVWRLCRCGCGKVVVLPGGDKVIRCPGKALAASIVAEHNCTGRVLELLERVRPSLVTLRGRLHDDRDYNGAASVAELLVAIDGDLEEPE
jgi:hypothetical protein